MRLLSIRPTMTLKLLASIGCLLAITFVVGGVAIANLGIASVHTAPLPLVARRWRSSFGRPPARDRRADPRWRRRVVELRHRRERGRVRFAQLIAARHGVWAKPTLEEH